MTELISHSRVVQDRLHHATLLAVNTALQDRSSRELFSLSARVASRWHLFQAADSREPSRKNQR